MSNTAIRISPMSPVIGAEIGNVDLTSTLDDRTFAAIHDALMQHCVIFFRDQPMEPHQLRDFSARFGKLSPHPYLPNVGGVSEITLFENDRDRPPILNLWHTDSTFLDEPPMGAVLYAHLTPPVGGDTIWASMYAAYDALSDRMQRFLSGLTAVHSVDPANYARARGEEVQPEQSTIVSAEHPVVSVHPVSGRKCLYVNSAITESIKGLKKSESDSLLQMLFRHVETPEFQVRFRWRRHSIAIWDNRCTQHYAVADYWPERRVMYRAAIDGGPVRADPLQDAA